MSNQKRVTGGLEAAEAMRRVDFRATPTHQVRRRAGVPGGGKLDPARIVTLKSGRRIAVVGTTRGAYFLDGDDSRLEPR